MYTEATHTTISKVVGEIIQMSRICQCFILILFSVKIVLSEIKPAAFSGEELLTA